MKGVEIPDDEVRLGELEMIFEKEYGTWNKPALEKEAKALLARRKAEESKVEAERLAQEWERASEEGNETLQADIERKIMALRRVK